MSDLPYAEGFREIQVSQLQEALVESARLRAQTEDAVETIREQQAATLEELGATRAQLAQVRADLDAARQDLATLQSSRSWRVTSPLRSVVERYRARQHRPV